MEKTAIEKCQQRQIRKNINITSCGYRKVVLIYIHRKIQQIFKKVLPFENPQLISHFFMNFLVIQSGSEFRAQSSDLFKIIDVQQKIMLQIFSYVQLLTIMLIFAGYISKFSIEDSQLKTENEIPCNHKHKYSYNNQSHGFVSS